jgi:hypothetical protein
MRRWTWMLGGSGVLLALILMGQTVTRSGFRPTPGSTAVWTLPLNDAEGCFQSDGAGVVSLATCGEGGGSPLTVKEEDGTPSVDNVTEIKVSSGTLTDNGSGSVSVVTGGGGGSGDVESVGDCTAGACLDGTADGGTNFALYDGDSHKATFQTADLSENRTYTFPDATGTVALTSTIPFTSLTGVMLGRAVNQNILNETETAVIWDTEHLDENNYAEQVTNPTRVTIPTTGWCTVSTHIEYTDTNGTNVRTIYIKVNGGAHVSKVQYTASGGLTILALAMPYKFTAGDYYEVWTWQGSGGTRTIQGRTHALCLR